VSGRTAGFGNSTRAMGRIIMILRASVRGDGLCFSIGSPLLASFVGSQRNERQQEQEE